MEATILLFAGDYNLDLVVISCVWSTFCCNMHLNLLVCIPYLKRQLKYQKSSTNEEELCKKIQASSPSEAYVSWDFPSCGRIMGYILELQRGWQFDTPLCSAKSGLLSSYDGHLRNLN